ncbi:hypothetical protein EJB05_25785 [Eragrostis curvula]|uniref:Uncharacterized protein n=1 Tax=Eragrostis curvula TaxID=38414 RepID=A0A5J9UJD8_9POAL|nr:hypothetical protein EJB05_25785 [Eragrostis curvula]
MPPSTAGYHAQPPQRSSEASTIVVGQKLKQQLEERLTSITKSLRHQSRVCNHNDLRHQESSDGDTHSP